MDPTWNWGGYNPEALPAGQYTVQVTDANLCNVALPFLITEPGEFVLELTSTIPECTDPTTVGNHQRIVGGGTGEVAFDWGGINPDAVFHGRTYTVVAIEARVKPKTLSRGLPGGNSRIVGLLGAQRLLQGDSAAYYYEFTQGSTYEWTFTGATEEEVNQIFAISLLWDSVGTTSCD